jgi:hypothetical protein
MLVSCPECAYQISKFAETCPKCGLPAAGKRSEEWSDMMARLYDGKQLKLIGNPMRCSTSGCEAFLPDPVRVTVKIEKMIVRIHHLLCV